MMTSSKQTTAKLAKFIYYATQIRLEIPTIFIYHKSSSANVLLFSLYMYNLNIVLHLYVHVSSHILCCGLKTVLWRLVPNKFNQILINLILSE